MTDSADLQTAITVRVATQRLVALTSWDSPSSTSVNTTRLGAACDDTIADFTSQKLTYDGSKADHVSIAVRWALLKLREYQLGPNDPRVKADRDSLLAELANIRAAHNVTPDPTGGYASYSSSRGTRGRFGNFIMDKIRKRPGTSSGSELEAGGDW